MLLLVPSDPLDPRRPDEHFAEEATAARALGLSVGLVDHDALGREGGASEGVARVPASPSPAVYRGWMLRSEQYAAFEVALAERQVTLLTSAREYQQAHELPGWYAPLETVTPRSVWTRGHDELDFRDGCARLGNGAAVLRDYAKSMKHYWKEAAFIPDVGDPDAAWRVAQRFLALRGDDFVGGLVLRRFEPFEPFEVRTWWREGACMMTTPHPDAATTEVLPALDLSFLLPLMKAFPLPYVTVDLARRDDGAWRVIELGDGQVSDRPRSVPASTFLASLDLARARRSPA